MGDEDFSISRRDEGGAAVVAPVGEVDLRTVDAVRAALEQATGEASRVVLDLRQVTFIDSSGLRLLVEADALSRRDGFAFAVVRGPAALDRLLEVTGLETRLELHDDAARAVDGGGTA